MTKHQIITLIYPVQLADRKLDKVTLRRPTLGDMLDYPIAGGNDLSGEVALIAHLCGLHDDDMRQLDAADYDLLQAALIRFRSKRKAEKHPPAGAGPVAPDSVEPDGVSGPDMG